MSGSSTPGAPNRPVGPSEWIPAAVALAGALSIYPIAALIGGSLFFGIAVVGAVAVVLFLIPQVGRYIRDTRYDIELLADLKPPAFNRHEQLLTLVAVLLLAAPPLVVWLVGGGELPRNTLVIAVAIVAVVFGYFAREVITWAVLRRDLDDGSIRVARLHAEMALVREIPWVETKLSVAQRMMRDPHCPTQAYFAELERKFTKLDPSANADEHKRMDMLLAGVALERAGNPEEAAYAYRAALISSRADESVSLAAALKLVGVLEELDPQSLDRDASAQERDPGTGERVPPT